MADCFWDAGIFPPGIGLYRRNPDNFATSPPGCPSSVARLRRVEKPRLYGPSSVAD
jgi:hypothetical protein